MAKEAKPSTAQAMWPICPTCGPHQSWSSLERLWGYAQIGSFEIDEEGSIDCDWTGETDVDWDSQEQVGGKWLTCQGCWESYDPGELRWVPAGEVGESDDENDDD